MDTGYIPPTPAMTMDEFFSDPHEMGRPMFDDDMDDMFALDAESSMQPLFAPLSSGDFGGDAPFMMADSPRMCCHGAPAQAAGSSTPGSLISSASASSDFGSPVVAGATQVPFHGLATPPNYPAMGSDCP